MSREFGSRVKARPQRACAHIELSIEIIVVAWVVRPSRGGRSYASDQILPPQPTSYSNQPPSGGFLRFGPTGSQKSCLLGSALAENSDIPLHLEAVFGIGGSAPIRSPSPPATGNFIAMPAVAAAMIGMNAKASGIVISINLEQ